MTGTHTRFIGVTMTNSIDFVRRVFAVWQSGDSVLLLRNAHDEERLTAFDVQETVTPAAETGWASLTFTPVQSDSVAQVSFTSGTEGNPKGILLTHANLADMVERLNSVMQMDASIREYVGVPVYHSFGFGRCRAIATFGGRFYVPPAGFDPLEIRDMLVRGEINAISAVPSLWRTLFECEDLFGDECSRVRWIEIGSQYMSAAEKLRLKALFPNARIVQHYGLTEASRSTFLDISATQDPTLLESVGKPVGDTRIQCLGDGRIAIRGSLTSRRRWAAGEYEDILVDGWLETSDLGQLKDGYLFYLGRADDQINCGGIKLSPDRIEQAVRNRLALEGGLACARVPDPMRGDGVVLAVRQDVPIDDGHVRKAAEQVLEAMGVAIGRSLHLLRLELLPVTDTGKIKRKALQDLFLQQQAVPVSNAGKAASTSVADLSPRELELMTLWQQLLNVDDIGLHESFYDLGGDSLTAITAIIKMKKLGVPEAICRGILQGQTIAELAHREQQTAGSSHAPTADTNALIQCAGGGSAVVSLAGDSMAAMRNNMNIRIVRGILVLLVIFAHWSEGMFNYLPRGLSDIQPWLAPLMAAGTPGFAILYGVAMGYSFYPLFVRTPSRLAGLLKPIALLLAGGIVLLAGVDCLEIYLHGQPMTATVVANTFYGVLTFYLLATLTIYGWFALIRWLDLPVFSAVVLAVGCHLLYLNVMQPLGAIPAEGIVELAKILVAAKYSYFNMMCGVLLGVALGIGLLDNKTLLARRGFAVLALLLIACAVWLSQVVGELGQWAIWPTRKVEAWRWFFYLGLGLLLLAIFDRLLSHYHRFPRFIAGLFQIVAVIGLMAFPFFVLHELVEPVKNILGATGLPNSIALLISMTAFLVGAFYIVRLGHRFQF